MKQRTKRVESEIRMLDIDTLCAYISMGRTRAAEFGEQCGAKRKMGKRVLYDKTIIDAALDKLESNL